MHVLIIEDEDKTAETVELYLRNANFTVSRADDGLWGLELARKAAPDLILLDLMLPGLGGLELCRRLRRTCDTPILMLTARATEEERVKGLELGADDYITKPFSPRELVLRVEAVLRRVQPAQREERLHFDGLALDRATRVVSVDGEPLDPALTPTEFALLEAMLGAPQRVFTRSELIERALGYDFEGEERVIDAHVKNLRRKIDRAGATSSRIRTVFGVGYRLSLREQDDE